MGNICGAGEQRLRERLIREYEEEQRQRLQRQLDEEARAAEEEIKRKEEEAAFEAAREAQLRAEAEAKKREEDRIRNLAAQEIQASIPMLRDSLNQVADTTEKLIGHVTESLQENLEARAARLQQQLGFEIESLRNQTDDSTLKIKSTLTEHQTTTQEQILRIDLNTARCENLNDETARLHSKITSVRGRVSHIEEQQLILSESIESLNAAIDKWNADEEVSPALEKYIQDQISLQMSLLPNSPSPPCCPPVWDDDKLTAIDKKLEELREAYANLYDADESKKSQIEGLRSMLMEHARKIKALETEDLVDSESSFLDENPGGPGGGVSSGTGAGAGGQATTVDDKSGAQHFTIASEGAVATPPGTPRSKAANTANKSQPSNSPDKAAENPYEHLFKEWGEHSELDPRAIPRITRHLDNTSEYQSIDWEVLNHVWVKSRAAFTIFDNQQSKNSQFPPLRTKHTLRIWKEQAFLWAYAILRCGGSRVGLGNQIVTKSFQDGFDGELHLCQVEKRDISSLMFSIEDGFQPHLNVLHDKVEELLQHTTRMDGMPIDLYISLLGTIFKCERELSDGRNIRNDRSRARFALDTMGIRSEIKGVLRLKMAELPKDYEYKDFANCVRHMAITDSKRYDSENTHTKNKKGERDFLNELLVMFNILEPGKDNIENFSLHQKINQYFRHGGTNAGAIFSTGGRPTGGPGATPGDGGTKDACPLGENCSHLSTTGLCKKRHTRREYAVCLQRFEANHPEKYRKWKADKEKRAEEKKKKAGDGGAGAGAGGK